MTIASRNAEYTPSVYREQGGNTLRVRSAGRIVSEDELWGNCPMMNWLLDPSIGVHLIEDW